MSPRSVHILSQKALESIVRDGEPQASQIPVVCAHPPATSTNNHSQLTRRQLSQRQRRQNEKLIQTVPIARRPYKDPPQEHVIGQLTVGDQSSMMTLQESRVHHRRLRTLSRKAQESIIHNEDPPTRRIPVISAHSPATSANNQGQLTSRQRSQRQRRQNEALMQTLPTARQPYKDPPQQHDLGRMDVSCQFCGASSGKLHLTCSYYQLLTQLIDLTVLFINLTVLFKIICLTLSQ